MLSSKHSSLQQFLHTPSVQSHALLPCSASHASVPAQLVPMYVRLKPAGHAGSGGWPSLLKHVFTWGRWRGDIREMPGRCRGDVGEMSGRYGLGLQWVLPVCALAAGEAASVAQLPARLG